MSYLNAEPWRPRHSYSEELPPTGTYQGLGPSVGGYGVASSRWLLEMTDDDDESVRVLIAGDGSEWSEGDDE